MKKLNKKIGLIALLITGISVIGFLYSCDKDKDSSEQSTKAKYSDDELLKAISFVGQGKVIKEQGKGKSTKALTQSTITGTTAIIWKIARPKKDCQSGFGLCNPRMVQTSSITYFEDDAIYMDASKVDWNNFNIELAYSPSIDLKNVQFNIDEDLEVFNESTGRVEAVIRADVYPFTERVGLVGGFALQAVPISATLNTNTNATLLLK